MYFNTKSFIGTLLFLFCFQVHSESKDEIVQRGKELYNGAGSCVACHMEDGKGQKEIFLRLR